MYAIPWYVVLFVSIPESYLIIILGFALYNLEMRFRHALIISIITSIIIYFVRLTDVVFGLHTIIGLIIVVGLTALFTKLPLRKIISPALTGTIIIALSQCLILPFELMLTSVDARNLAEVPWLNIVFFIPEALIIIIMYWMVKKYHLNIVDLKEGEKDIQDN